MGFYNYNPHILVIGLKGNCYCQIMSVYFVWACEVKTCNYLVLSGETNLACRFPTLTRTSYCIILVKIPNYYHMIYERISRSTSNRNEWERPFNSLPSCFFAVVIFLVEVPTFLVDMPTCRGVAYFLG